MFGKILSRVAVFGLVTLASAGASAHDGNGPFVTLNSGSYALWSGTYTDPTIRIILTVSDYYNPATCGNNDSYMVSTTISAESRQRLYSTLLAAKLAGKPVKLVLETANNVCEQGRPKVVSVIVT